MVVLVACAERQAVDTIELELSHPTGQAISADPSIDFCSSGFITASGRWQVHLEEEGGGAEVAVMVTSPSGERFHGVLDDSEQLEPGFSGSGTAKLYPEDNPNAEPSTLQVAWLCS
ncbi:MAG TPA: hypothetical protein VFZ06_01490 [Acidimicrobiia bacterium]|nr:hypothetical protein [Acidimicrobiia bacterium]